MTDENKPPEKEIPWLRNPRNRGIINGVAVFGLLCLAQIDGLLEDPRPLTGHDLVAYAVTGLAAGVLIYSFYNWRERRAKKKESETGT